MCWDTALTNLDTVPASPELKIIRGGGLIQPQGQSDMWADRSAHCSKCFKGNRQGVSLMKMAVREQGSEELTGD